jgi:hypothetical protein
MRTHPAHDGAVASRVTTWLLVVIGGWAAVIAISAAFCSFVANFMR